MCVCVCESTAPRPVSTMVEAWGRAFSMCNTCNT